MIDCMMNYLKAAWLGIVVWFIFALVIGFLAGGWWGILIAFGLAVFFTLLWVFMACQRNLSR